MLTPANDAASNPCKTMMHVIEENCEATALQITQLIVHALHKQGWTFIHSSEISHLYEQENEEQETAA